MKKIKLGFILIILTLLSLNCIGQNKVYATKSGDYYYTVSNGEATITKFAEEFVSKATVPNMIDGYPVTSIGSKAFYGHKYLTSVTIPEGVISIDSNAFYGCDKLTAITIPDGVTSIGDKVFYSCDTLSNVTIPDSVTSIGEDVFRGCSKLQNIIVDEDNKFYSSVDGSLFDKSKTTLIAYAIGKNDTYYEIPNNVTSIGEGAFAGCITLSNVTIPDSVTSIGEGAFAGCITLTNVTIPDSVTSIGEGAFSGCESLKSIMIPNSVTSIGSEAFFGCESITNITIPNGLTSLENETFYDCNSLTNITIPSSITIVGDGVFAACDNLTDVYYSGSETEWNNISIGSDNSPLTNASIHCEKKDAIVITYDANKGSNAPEPQYTDENVTIVISCDIPVRDGFIFLGWAKSAGATKPEYKSGDSIEIKTENVTLYAVWQRNVITDSLVVNNIIMVTPTNAQVGDCIIVACYKESKIVYTDTYLFGGETTIPFIPDAEYDIIKIMVWESFHNLKPLSSVEEL